MDYRIDLAVLEEQENYTRFGLTLHNLSDVDLQHWQLNVSFRRYIQPDSLTQGRIEQVGGLCTFIPQAPHTLAANAHYYVEFGCQTAPFQLLNDGFDDAIIHTVIQNKRHNIKVAVTPIALKSANKQNLHPNTPTNYQGIIPRPVSLQLTAGKFDLAQNIIFQSHSNQSKAALTWLASELSTLLDNTIK